jgi:hypothetical protein
MAVGVLLGVAVTLLAGWLLAARAISGTTAPVPAIMTQVPNATGIVLYEGSQFSTGSLDDVTGEFTAPAGCNDAILTYTGRSEAGGAARVTWRLHNTTGTESGVTVGPVDIPPQSGAEWVPLTPGQTYSMDVHTFGVTVVYTLTCE